MRYVKVNSYRSIVSVKRTGNYFKPTRCNRLQAGSMTLLRVKYLLPHSRYGEDGADKQEPRLKRPPVQKTHDSEAYSLALISLDEIG